MLLVSSATVPLGSLFSREWVSPADIVSDWLLPSGTSPVGHPLMLTVGSVASTLTWPVVALDSLPALSVALARVVVSARGRERMARGVARDPASGAAVRKVRVVRHARDVRARVPDRDRVLEPRPEVRRGRGRGRVRRRGRSPVNLHRAR